MTDTGNIAGELRDAAKSLETYASISGINVCSLLKRAAAALEARQPVQVTDEMVTAAQAELLDHRQRANNCTANVRRALTAALTKGPTT